MLEIAEFNEKCLINIICLINLELQEETGIKSSDVDIDPNFRFEHVISDVILIVMNLIL